MGAQIHELAVLVRPLLCASPVALKQLDFRKICRSASYNVETLGDRVGRSYTMDRKTFPIPLLGKEPAARKGLYRRPVGRVPESRLEAYWPRIEEGVIFEVESMSA
ncbi:MAG: hypothetical protein M3178_01885 [Pseudomonadota bacterium]|nr:hypothetical protein [Pseudomonadota bacterium]